jgi:hypothetical protein
MQNRLVKATLSAAGLVVSTLAALAAEPNPYAGFDQGVFLPYINAPADDADITTQPRLRISFGGPSRIVVMDTGSTGVVVSAGDIPDLDTLPAMPGKLTYTSSGKVMVGNWVTTPVTIEGRNGAKFVTKPMPVLAVSEIQCLGTARNCHPLSDPRGVAMLGIGFGREGDDQAESTPDKNAFLSGTGGERFRRGYVVTRTGVHVGLTAANAGEDFARVKLEPNPSVTGDWSAATVCIAVNGKSPAVCGTSLVDTGVTGMFLTLPPDLVGDSVTENDSGAKTLANGTALAFFFPGTDPDKPVAEASYGFDVAQQTNPLEPEFLDLNTTRAPFVNTSVHFLNGFDLLYDADGGYIGYRWTGHADSRLGFAKPSP